jgi:hypothetical protein
MEPTPNLEYIIKRDPIMKEEIENIIDSYYGYSRPEIDNLQVLDESPELGITCLRWREVKSRKTITVKSILQDGRRAILPIT